MNGAGRGQPHRSRRRLAHGTAFTAILVLAVGGLASPAAEGTWDDGVVVTTGFGAAPDWLAPVVEATVVAKPAGYLPGSIREGGTYYVYARVSDGGQPASGVSATTADMSLVTPDGLAVPLVPGTYSAGGVSYTYRSDLLTASTALAEGNLPYSIRSTDVAGNTRTQTGYSVIVDNVAPLASSIQTTNAVGGVPGQAEAGDTIRFTYSERIDPDSVLAGWTGGSTNVVVRLVDGGCSAVLLDTVCSNDSVEVYDATNLTRLSLGTVKLGSGDYYGTAVGTAPPLTFGATGLPSTMAQSQRDITVTLGTPSATAGTAALASAMVWSPSSAAYDAAGNPAKSTPVTETGIDDKEF